MDIFCSVSLYGIALTFCQFNLCVCACVCVLSLRLTEPYTVKITQLTLKSHIVLCSYKCPSLLCFDFSIRLSYFPSMAFKKP